MKKNNKKYIIFLLIILIISIIFNSVVHAANLDYNNLCSDAGINTTMKMIGIFLNIIKILVPMIIIGFGMVDFGKAALSNDEKAVNKATGALIRRFVAGLIIFFVPTIVLAIMNALEPSIGNYENSQMYACIKCMLDPNGSC